MNLEASLGPTVRTYAPPDRTSSFAFALAFGTLAAVAWWPGSQLEGRIWAVPFFLAALVLALTSFKHVLRLVGPGKRVAVYQRGIRVGRRTYRWDELKRVAYSREASHADGNAVDHHWRFERKDGKVNHFHVRDDGLGLYLDVAELEGLLSANVRAYENLHAPKVTTVAADPFTVGAAELPDGAEVAARLDERTEWSDVLELLRRGRARCRRVRLEFRARAVGTGLAVIALKTVTAFLVLGALGAGLLVALRGGEALLADEPTLDTIIEALALPDSFVGYATLCLGSGLAFWAGSRIESRFRGLHPRAQRFQAVADRLRATGPEAVEALAGHVRAGRPFGIYLRSFAGEHFRFLEASPNLAELPEIEPIARELDTEIARLVSDRMPLFALANVGDPTPPAEVAQLFVADETWERTATELLRRADLVVLHLAQATPSLLCELVVLDELDARDRTLVIAGEALADQPDLEALLKRFPHRAAETPEAIEKSLDDLALHLDGLRQEAAEEKA